MAKSNIDSVRQQDLEAIEKFRKCENTIREQVEKVIFGQKKIIDQLLISLFCKGHCVIVGVPGLAKTLLISTLAKILNLDFSRIQFTPDLMPSDITGTDILEVDNKTGKREFRFIKGPIFSNIVLADEINRTPPKTQAALLQAMQEYEVTAGGNTHSLPLPFFVLATQNPIEQEGTYPLPEAQLDRFMFYLSIDYPEIEDEINIARATTGDTRLEVKPVLSAEDIISIQEIVRRVPVSDHVIRYAVNIARATRPEEKDPLEYVKNFVSWGAGVRASQYLILGAKANAIMDGRYVASCKDVQAVCLPVLRHRIITNFNAEADGVRSEDIIQHILEKIEEPGE